MKRTNIQALWYLLLDGLVSAVCILLAPRAGYSPVTQRYGPGGRDKSKLALSSVLLLCRRKSVVGV